MDSTYLASLSTLNAAAAQTAIATQGAYNCPGTAVNPNFATVGLPAIPSIAQTVYIDTHNDQPPKVSNDAMNSTLFNFAKSWNHPIADGLQAFFDPGYMGQVNFVREANNVLGLPADGPLSAADLAIALTAADGAGSVPARIGSFGQSATQLSRWCVTFTVKGNHFPGSISFSPTTSTPLIQKIDMSSAPVDCE